MNNLIVEMDYEDIRRQMAKIEINFDTGIIKEVARFLDAYFSSRPVENQCYQVAAATAIICETYRLPTVASSSSAGSGIKIEKIMRNIGTLSKEEFLSTVEKLAKQCQQDNHKLLQKIQKLKTSFRLFKKYKEIFIQLGKQASLPSKSIEDLMSFYWIVFLLLKAHLETVSDISESTKILGFLLLQLFSNIYAKLPKKKVLSVICANDKLPYVTQPSKQIQTRILSDIEEAITNLQTYRCCKGYMRDKKFKEDPLMMSRFIDDLDEIYKREKIEGNDVDQITFLQLSKNLTPLAFYNPLSNFGPTINKVLNFESEDQSFESGLDSDHQIRTMGHLMQEESSFLEGESKFPAHLFSSSAKNPMQTQTEIQKSDFSTMNATPVGLGVAKSSWFQEYINKYNKKKLQMEMTQGMEKEIINFCTSKIKQQVQRMIPYAQNSQKQRQYIWELFLTLLKDFSVKSQIKMQETYKPLLCLCGCLYNHTMRPLNVEYRKYCKIYEADLIKSLEIIYAINQRVSLPEFIKEYLYDLEKHVLIKEIWNCNRGFTLLQNKQSFNPHIYQRFEKHIYQRIKDICEVLNVEPSTSKRVDSLITKIIQKKLFLLENNKLDPMIICSILACLSVDTKKNSHGISLLYQRYSMNKFMPHSEFHGINQSISNQMTLMSYYNYVFVPEIKELGEGMTFNPIKEEDLKSTKITEKEKIPPVSKFFNESFSSKKPIDLKQISLKQNSCSEGEDPKKRPPV